MIIVFVLHCAAKTGSGHLLVMKSDEENRNEKQK